MGCVSGYAQPVQLYLLSQFFLMYVRKNPLFIRTLCMMCLLHII